MIEAWLVVDRYHNRAVFLDETRAYLYAAKVHGIIIELIRKTA